jgi:hypothetical protein
MKNSFENKPSIASNNSVLNCIIQSLKNISFFSNIVENNIYLIKIFKIYSAINIFKLSNSSDKFILTKMRLGLLQFECNKRK